ncbi:hypothetical protein MNBD_IGNAVI01-2065 [hydrothermal vent metagenome]|uniref:Zinc resistance-associated protein n=1 Tax=hydrothermal vent metagenome TaxID=652676 RepID=A0A3B1CNR5_9ZZZZ
MKRSIIVSLLVTFFLGTAIMFAQPQKPFGPMMGQKGSGGFMMQKMLNLTDEQTATFNDIRYKHQMEAIDLQAELKKNQAKVRKMMTDQNINSDELLQLTKANSEIMAKMRTSKTQMWLDVYNILNNDQKEIWTTRFSQFGNNGQGKGYRAGGRHHGRHGCMGNNKQGSGYKNFRGYDQ